ncbi:MAG: thiamine phosphate synthase [Rhodospirillaceae bacterium]|jgi:thiamine monophosphate synthase|nr:thiamine phosphate synthase [Rhodospirillaceae bacterium]
MIQLIYLAKHLNFYGRIQKKRPKINLPTLALLTDNQQLTDLLKKINSLPKGSLVIFRHYNCPDRALLANKAVILCRARRINFIIAKDINLAITLGVGLHLPEYSIPYVPVKLRLRHNKIRPDLLLTAAVHGTIALKQANHLGVNATLISPVFPTTSHIGLSSIGCIAFRRLVRLATTGTYALGGITSHTVISLVGSGAIGIATVSGFNDYQSK